MSEYPQRNIGFDSEGWALDLQTDAYLKSGQLNATLYTNANGWLWGEVERKWTWPIANDAPRPNSSNYQARHPTRYTWREDVEAWARYLVNNYDVWCNTYYDHPENYGRDTTSIDVWGSAGRNDPIDSSVGQEVFDLLFYDPGKPDIEWCIWQRWLWSYGGGWEPFGTEPFSWHDDHIHVTYF